MFIRCIIQQQYLLLFKSFLFVSTGAQISSAEL